MGALPLADRIGLPTRPGPEHLPAAAYDPARRQFRAADALAALALGPGERPTLFLTGADLSLPGAAYVFGASVPAAGVGLASTFRLEGRVDRLRSVIHHEAAHLLGLDHCAAPRCALHPAHAAADLDARGEALCPACLRAAAGGAP